MTENIKYNEPVEKLIEKLHSKWERLFPDNPELENVFMEN